MENRTAPVGCTLCASSGTTMPGRSGARSISMPSASTRVAKRALEDGNPGPDASCGDVLRAEARGDGTLREHRRVLVRDDALRQLEPITAYTGQWLSQAAVPAGGGGHPWSIRERWGVPHVLCMTAAQEGGPVAVVIKAEAGDGSIHRPSTTRARGGISPCCFMADPCKNCRRNWCKTGSVTARGATLH